MGDGAEPRISFAVCDGRVVDPGSGVDRFDDVVVIDGRVASIGGPIPPEVPRLDAGGLIVCPGLIDLHVHLREPGAAHKETIATGTRAAAAGGFTSVACMPNTTPVMDAPEVLERVLNRARDAGHCRVYPIAAMTIGRRGAQLVDMAALRACGAVAFSDDGDGVEQDDVMRAAMEQARRLGVPIIQHCEFKAVSAGGVMHKGPVSERLGLPGIDPRAEEAMIDRDVRLVRETGARYHVAHISTAGGVELVRRAKAEGLPVSAEVCPHHLMLTDEACSDLDPNTKMHPPLRSAADVRACVAGLADGTINCVVTDHAPHARDEKSRGFLDAPFGIVGLETALALCVESLVTPGILSWSELIDRMSRSPAALLGLPGGTLSPGSAADIVMIDPKVRWRIDAARFHSMGRNTPFDGRAVVGRPVVTIVGGRVTYRDPSAVERFGALDRR